MNIDFPFIAVDWGTTRMRAMLCLPDQRELERDLVILRSSLRPDGVHVRVHSPDTAPGGLAPADPSLEDSYLVAMQRAAAVR